MQAATTILQTPRQMRVIPSLSERDRQRAAEAKARREKAQANMPVADFRREIMLPKKEPAVIPSAPSAPAVIAPVEPSVTKLRVAAYCRVSTGSEEQESSIENQRAHYESVIKANPGWELADIYWEAAVSGTKKDSRPELQRLLADCEAGKVQLVLTKSISRFARNTTDCLEMIRMLKDRGVAVRFEKEQVDTGSMESEMMLTLFSTFAEEESHSISRNTTWTKRKQFQEGTFKYSIAPYGYRLTGGTFEVDETEAPIVREIYDCVLSGMGTPAIAKRLNERGVPTGTKKNDGSPGEWNSYMLTKMIRNVVYIGDVLMQKTYRDEHFHLMINYGERPQYYSEGHHPAIVSRETFELANAALSQRGKEKGNVPRENRQLRDNPHNNRYAFSGKLKCGCCGGTMRRISQKVKDGTQYHWGCAAHIADKEKCWMTREYEESIQNAFVTLLNKLCFAGDAVVDTYLMALRNEHSLRHRDRIKEYEDRLEKISVEKHRLTVLISKGCGEPVSLRRKTLELDAEANDIRAELALLSGDPVQVNAAMNLKERLAEWKKQRTDEFPGRLFTDIVDHAVVRTAVEVEFHLKCSMVLTEQQ